MNASGKQFTLFIILTDILNVLYCTFFAIAGGREIAMVKNCVLLEQAQV